MGVGPNFVLDKGFVATGSSAYKAGELVGLSGDGTKCARVTSAGGMAIGVCMEDVDAAKVTTGKVVVNVRLLGIARVLAGAAVAVGARLTTNASAQAVTSAPAAGTNSNVLGVALTAASAAGEYIDVLLTPGESAQG